MNTGAQFALLFAIILLSTTFQIGWCANLEYFSLVRLSILILAMSCTGMVIYFLQSHSMENASGIKRFSPSMPVAINNALRYFPVRNNALRYFPVRNVPSTLITGLQCLNASTHCGKHQYACFITGLMEPLCISCLPVLWMHHFILGLKCAIAFNIFGTLPYASFQSPHNIAIACYLALQAFPNYRVKYGKAWRAKQHAIAMLWGDWGVLVCCFNHSKYILNWESRWIGPPKTMLFARRFQVLTWATCFSSQFFIPLCLRWSILHVNIANINAVLVYSKTCK